MTSIVIVYVVSFSFPSIIYTYFFQRFSRLNRPVDTNAAYLLGTFIVAGVSVHLSSLAIIMAFEPSPWGIWKFLSLKELFATYHLPDELKGDHTIAHVDAIKKFILVLASYIVFTSILASVFGTISARLVLYGIWPFTLLRTYYGGLYQILAGYNRPAVRVSILTNISMKNSYLMYHGFLEDIKLNATGAIDFVVIYAPSKSLGIFSPKLGTMKGGKEKPIGIDQPNRAEAYLDQRLFVEGQDIANVYFERWRFQKYNWRGVPVEVA